MSKNCLVNHVDSYLKIHLYIFDNLWRDATSDTSFSEKDFKKARRERNYPGNHKLIEEITSEELNRSTAIISGISKERETPAWRRQANKFLIKEKR